MQSSTIDIGKAMFVQLADIFLHIYIIHEKAKH